MARGSARRNYVRDGRGRFASTPGGGAKKAKPKPGGFRQRQAVKLAKQRGQLGILGAPAKAAKARVKATKARTGPGARPQQRGALTRAKNTAEALSDRRKLPAARPSGVLAKGVKAKPAAGSRVKPSRPGQQSTDQALKRPKQKRSPVGQAQSKKGGKKVDVQIKRAAAGGEYGPDGHFYPAGAWMPLGKFKGGDSAKGKGMGADQQQQQGKDGGGARVVGSRQQKKDPPPLFPTGQARSSTVKISSRGARNVDKYYGNQGYYSGYKRGKDGRVEMPGTGLWNPISALAARIAPKEVGKAIARLRKAAKNKKEFDYGVAEARAGLRGWGGDNFAYDRQRREGLLPKGMTSNQFLRAGQLEAAIAAIAGQRASRQNNRRNVSEEFAWILNNILGSRARRAPSRKPQQSSAGRRVIRIKTSPSRLAFRPVSTKGLIAAGGSRWQKDKFDRIYFNQPNTGKVFFDRNTRKMVNQSGDQRGAALAARMLRAGRRKPANPWRAGRIAAKS